MTTVSDADALAVVHSTYFNLIPITKIYVIPEVRLMTSVSPSRCFSMARR